MPRRRRPSCPTCRPSATPPGTRRTATPAAAAARRRRDGQPPVRPATRSATRCPFPTATRSSTRSTCTAAWVTQRGRAPTAAQYASISSWAVGASARSTTSTGSPSRSLACTRRRAASRCPGGTATWSTGTRASGTDATRSGSRDRPSHDADGHPPGPQTVEDVQRRQAVGADAPRPDAALAERSIVRIIPPSLPWQYPTVHAVGAGGELGGGLVEPVHRPQDVPGLDAAVARRPGQRPCGSCARTAPRRGRPPARGSAATAVAS